MIESTQPNDPGSQGESLLSGPAFELKMTFDVAAGVCLFEWARPGETDPVGRGRLIPSDHPMGRHFTLNWQYEGVGAARKDHCGNTSASAHALARRIAAVLPVPGDSIRAGVLPDEDMGVLKAGVWTQLEVPPGEKAWRWVGTMIYRFSQAVSDAFERGSHGQEGGRTALGGMARHVAGLAPLATARYQPAGKLLHLSVTFDQSEERTTFVWNHPSSREIVVTGSVRMTGRDELTWELLEGDHQEITTTSTHRNAVRGALGHWITRFPTNRATFRGFRVFREPGSKKFTRAEEPPFTEDESPLSWVEEGLMMMVEVMRYDFSPMGRMMAQVSENFEYEPFDPSYAEKFVRKERKREEELAKRQETMARLAEERRKKKEAAALAKSQQRGRTSTGANATHPGPAPQRAPLPPVPVHLDMAPLSFQETAFPLNDLSAYALRERAALLWVSNQSDDLLCLPNCRIEHLEYQLRTALRVLGPMRGRALLSDEVGLGKTVEAGLVIKELLTRGMVKRFLVLTVPSLVDQWEEELAEKFGLVTATTNHTKSKQDPESFWRDNLGIVASLHTVKQPAQFAMARGTHWDILVVDEAHYLRNRDSQAWQAVNGLPRHFLLLLTATPVQNSLDELYNLVTLLQPGQLPTPKEFRTRFVDPKRPRQPREPAELRRLLSQVMIRNTRANAGLNLPPRRAETILFEPDANEREFWSQWESDLREQLSNLNASQSSMWGRLLLQTSGSSPSAWRSALEKFPDRAAANEWKQASLLESSWRRKCDLVVPLTKREGGVVIFTQFLDTQSALADYLRAAGVVTFAINGSTPAVDRQPLTEEFHKQGGALILTHSGTEGRNLQFSHQLINFDLPWNPMEIEQRIGRLHRLGQRQPVRIYNFVQAGTLQQHLLELLQEKLNLFELVVGETGLVLGERFSSDEFAEEVFRRWRESDGHVAEALASLGDELAAARDSYSEVKQLDETLFAKDYESL